MVCAGAIRKKNVNNTVRWCLVIMVKFAFVNGRKLTIQGRARGHSRQSVLVFVTLETVLTTNAHTPLSPSSSDD
jgi:hypothetical protein